MAYRGDDLDLRTPSAASSDVTLSTDPYTVSQRSRTNASAANRAAAPIWVDETVLEACNHAYDVASAHRAPDVRLEHLIYALTRIEDAAETLEQRGVRVASLRREAAAVIATEIPVVQGAGKTNPRRADSFEEVLRLAAAHTYRRQAPVSVVELVHTLLDSTIEIPSLLHLLPAPPRPVVAPSETTLDVDTVRERVRNGGRATAQAQRTHTSDLASLSAAQSSSQQARIDAIEGSIRNLTAELASERKILSGVLQDLQRELMAQREDTSRHNSITPDKIQAIVGDRLQSLEQAFLSARPSITDLGPVQDRLLTIERSLQSEIATTRAAIETLSARPAPDLAPLVSPLAARLETVERLLVTERERTDAGIASLSAALNALAGQQNAQPAQAAERHWIPLNARLDALSATHEGNHATVSDVLTEAQRRLGVLDGALATHTTQTAEAATLAAQERAALRDQLLQLADALSQQSDGTREGFARLTESLTQDLSEVHDGLSQTHTNHQALATALDAQSEDIGQAFATLAARIDSLEKAAARPVEMLQALSLTVDKMHRVTVERYYRRNRFWYWLFGTDDWLAASWPSQSARIAEELRAIKH